MKRLLLLPLLFIGVSAWSASQQCQHPPIPKNIKGMDVFKYEEQVRPQLIKSGWKPNIDRENKESIFYNKKTPEAVCGTSSCQYSYTDKNGDQLFIHIGDFVYRVDLSCKS